MADFLNACCTGNLMYAKLIYYLCRPDIHYDTDAPFTYSCMRGHLEIAKWLYSLEDNFNIHANDDEAFRFACFGGHIEIAKLLVDICDNYYIEIEDNKIKSWKII